MCSPLTKSLVSRHALTFSVSTTQVFHFLPRSRLIRPFHSLTTLMGAKTLFQWCFVGHVTKVVTLILPKQKNLSGR